MTWQCRYFINDPGCEVMFVDVDLSTEDADFLIDCFLGDENFGGLDTDCCKSIKQAYDEVVQYEHECALENDYNYYSFYIDEKDNNTEPSEIFNNHYRFCFYLEEFDRDYIPDFLNESVSKSDFARADKIVDKAIEKYDYTIDELIEDCVGFDKVIEYLKSK